MKNINQIFVLILIACMSCNNKVERINPPVVIQSDERENEVPEKKYLILVYTLEIPIVVHFESEGFYDSIDGKIIPGVEDDYLEWKMVKEVSEVKEMINFDEDIKYRLFDSFDKEIGFNIKLLKYQQKSLRVTDKAMKLLSENSVKIVNREVMEFNSYSEASRTKRQILEGFNN